MSKTLTADRVTYLNMQAFSIQWDLTWNWDHYKSILP